jgi:hypothetical protein
MESLLDILYFSPFDVLIEGIYEKEFSDFSKDQN